MESYLKFTGRTQSEIGVNWLQLVEYIGKWRTKLEALQYFFHIQSEHGSKFLLQPIRVSITIEVGVGYEEDVHYFQSSSHINYRQAELDSPQNYFHQSQGANTQVEI